jgi:hypothetical protein
MMTALRQLAERLGAILREAGIWWGIGISAALAIGSLVLAVAIVIAWSPDHFKASRPPGAGRPRHPVARALAFVAMNLAGVVLVLLGLVMALPGIPGQGILTVIIGVTLLDLPGKRQFERRLIGRPSVLRRLNALRARFHRPALELD